MRIEYRCVETLPRLAWCACLREGGTAIDVILGPWVEVRPDRFFEGAWDGPLEGGAFVEAPTLVGPGGCLSGSGIVFAAPTNAFSRIYSVRGLWERGPCADTQGVERRLAAFHQGL